MIDLHTHLLPDWDDGAADSSVSERMIDVARQDGITKIVLTPHVFRMTKDGREPRDLAPRIRMFIEQASHEDVELFGGAEVHVQPDLIPAIKEFDLTVNGSSYVFIEFSAQQVPSGTMSLIYQMMLEGLIPIISHPERNLVFARSPHLLYELIRQGALGQVTAQSLTGGFGSAVQKTAKSFLRHGLVHLIASDAHDAEKRMGRLSNAAAIAAAIVGPLRAEAMVSAVPAAILANDQIPTFGDPIKPGRKHVRHFVFR